MKTFTVAILALVSLSGFTVTASVFLGGGGKRDANYGVVPDWYRSMRTQMDILYEQVGEAEDALEPICSPYSSAIAVSISTFNRKIDALEENITLLTSPRNSSAAVLEAYKVRHLQATFLDSYVSDEVRSLSGLELIMLPEPALHFTPALEDAWVRMATTAEDPQVLTQLAATFRSHRGSDRVKWVLIDMARYSPYSRVRKYAIMSLGKRFYDEPLVVALVEDAARRDPSLEVRQEASTLLPEMKRKNR